MERPSECMEEDLDRGLQGVPEDLLKQEPEVRVCRDVQFLSDQVRRVEEIPNRGGHLTKL